MRNLLTAVASLMVLATMAEVKPLQGPWLKEGETLVCFGDSITANERSYIRHLREALEPRGIKVLNAGVGGDKTPMALTRIGEVAAMKPDAVMIFFGANDSLVGRGRWRDEPIVDPVTFRDNLIWMIHYFRLKTDVRKFSIITPTGCCEGADIGEYGDVCVDYRRAAREAADRADAVLVPLDTEFEWVRRAELKDPKGKLLTADGIHFSPYGSQCAAKVMLRCWNMMQ